MTPLNFDTLLYISNHPIDLLYNQKLSPKREPELQKEYEKVLTVFKQLTPKEQIEFIKYQTPKIKYTSQSRKEYWCGLSLYPYYTEKNIDHYIIWNFEGKKITLEVVKYFIKTLKTIYKEKDIFGDFVLPIRDYKPTKFRATWWENPEPLKSVKQIKHTHLFIELNYT